MAGRHPGATHVYEVPDRPITNQRQQARTDVFGRFEAAIVGQIQVIGIIDCAGDMPGHTVYRLDFARKPLARAGIGQHDRILAQVFQYFRRSHDPFIAPGEFNDASRAGADCSTLRCIAGIDPGKSNSGVMVLQTGPKLLGLHNRVFHPMAKIQQD